MKRKGKTPTNKKPTFNMEFNLLNRLFNEYKKSKSSSERETIEENFFEKYESMLELFDKISVQNKQELLSIAENFRTLMKDSSTLQSKENLEKELFLNDSKESQKNLNIPLKIKQVQTGNKEENTVLNQKDVSPTELKKEEVKKEEFEKLKIEDEIKSSTLGTANNVKIEQPKIATQVSVNDDLNALNDLKKQVAKATSSYNKHSESIWFCFFHWHGATGRTRAKKFANEFNQIKDLDEAKSALISYLSNNTNGNTHPHSFRTMLLNEISMNSKHTLLKTSANYDNLLSNLESRFGLKSINQSNKI